MVSAAVVVAAVVVVVVTTVVVVTAVILQALKINKTYMFKPKIECAWTQN